MKTDKKGFSFIEFLVPIYFDAVKQAKRNAQLENMRIVKTSFPVDAWSFTTYFFYNPAYFPERLICPYNNQPYEVDWDDIWNWVGSTKKNYSLTYYSR